MNQEHHPLIKDFPDLKDKIHALKASNSHFARLEAEYEALDKDITRLENGVEHASDAEMEHKKQLRVVLKDELYAMLKA